MSERKTQEEYKSMSTPKIILRVVRHFLFEGRSFYSNCKQHLDLVKVLKPYKRANLISLRTYAIYLFSYISKSLKVDEKLKILTYHYSFLRSIFPTNKLKELFKNGIELYKERSDNDEFSVTLTSSGLLEFEGSLSLFFTVNGTKVFTLSFSFAPGSVYGVKDKTIVYVSCLQGVKINLRTFPGRQNFLVILFRQLFY